MFYLRYSMTKAKLISLTWKIPQIGSLSTTPTLFYFTCLYTSVCKDRAHIPASPHSKNPLRFWTWLSFCQVKWTEVEVVGWGFQGKSFLLFSFLPAFWKMGVIIGAPEAILGLEREGHKDCRVFCHAILGSQPLPGTAFLYTYFTWEETLVLKPLQSGLWKCQLNTIPSFSSSYDDITIHAVARGRNLGASPVFVSSIPAPRHPLHTSSHSPCTVDSTF